MAHTDDRTVVCPLCAGQGGFMTHQTRPCEVCRGTGKNLSGRMTLWNRPAQSSGARPPNACPACGGAGQFTVSSYEACAMCERTGRIALQPNTPPHHTHGDAFR